MNTDAYVKALATLPQQFDEIARREDGYLLERMSNGNYTLWRRVYHRQGEYHYAVAGDARPYRDGWQAGIIQPYDPITGSDWCAVYAGPDEQPAVQALWEARHDAW
jgi:hypothetical protein